MLVGKRQRKVTTGCGHVKSRGFTLLELMVTLAVAAVLATLAAPSFRQFVMTQRLTGASTELTAALSLARSEAIRRNADVDLIKLVSSGTWDKGWKVCVPSGACGTDLLTQQAMSGLSVVDSAAVAAVTFGKDGRAVSGTTKFTVAPAAAVSGVTSRCVSIGTSGLPSNARGACT